MSDKEEYESLLRKCLLQPLRPNLIPVHLCRIDQKWIGSGTLILNDDGSHKLIITAGHIFGAGTFDVYYYKVLQPFGNNTLLPINSVGLIGNQNSDVVGCIPGPAQYITGHSQIPKYTVLKNLTAYSLEHLNLEAISLVTGEHFPITSAITNEEGLKMFVIDYFSTSGQSGTGFLTTVSDNEMLVLQGTCPTNEPLRKVIQSTFSHPSIAVIGQLL